MICVYVTMDIEEMIVRACVIYINYLNLNTNIVCNMGKIVHNFESLKVAGYEVELSILKDSPRK